jgi:hypothetical protein
MVKERFCAEIDCGRLVMEEKESKCSKHRVNVGDNVFISIVLREPKDEFRVVSGQVSEIEEGGLVHVNFGEDIGLHDVALPSRLFRQRDEHDEHGWELKAELS